MKTVIEMAREAGFTEIDAHKNHGRIERFAELVRADEREACAKVCDYVPVPWLLANPAEKCAAAIRARSNL